MGMTLGQRRGFGQTEAVLLLAAAGVGLVVFLIAQFRGRYPMLELKLFRNMLFTINLVMGWLVFIVVAGQFLFPFFLEMVKGYSTQTVGLLMMITPAAMGGVAPLAGMLSDRFGSRGISVIGLLVIVGGCLAVSTLHAEVGVWGYLLRLAPLGIGFGLFVSPNNSAIMGEVPRQRLGVASGLMALSRTMGHTTGMPLFGVVFSLQVASMGSFSTLRNLAAASPEALVAGVAGAYRLAAYVVLTAAVLAVLALWIDRGRKSPA
jgi:MFS family permease